MTAGTWRGEGRELQPETPSALQLPPGIRGCWLCSGRGHHAQLDESGIDVGTRRYCDCRAGWYLRAIGVGVGL